MKTETVDPSGVIEQILALPNRVAIYCESDHSYAGFDTDDLKALAHRLADAERMVERYEKLVEAAHLISHRDWCIDLAANGKYRIGYEWSLNGWKYRKETFDTALEAFESLGDKGE